MILNDSESLLSTFYFTEISFLIEQPCAWSSLKAIRRKVSKCVENATVGANSTEWTSEEECGPASSLTLEVIEPNHSEAVKTSVNAILPCMPMCFYCSCLPFVGVLSCDWLVLSIHTLKCICFVLRRYLYNTYVIRTSHTQKQKIVTCRL